MSVTLAILGFTGEQVYRVVRWVYSVEERFHDLQKRENYLHGTFELPKENE